MSASWLEGSSGGDEVGLSSIGALEAGSAPHTHETNSCGEEKKNTVN